MQFSDLQRTCHPLGREGLKYKEYSACTSCLQQSYENSKACGVKWLRTEQFNLILKGDFIN
jgi:hypothetical protein